MEKRIYSIKDMEVRADEGERPKIRGYAAVFNSRSVPLLGFVEEIVPGAFRETLAADPDVRATIDHEGGLTTLGRTRSGTLRLAEDERGLRVEIDPPDTQAGRDVVALLQRGDVDQMSFMFRVPVGGDEWEDGGPDGLPIRRLRQVDLNDGDVSIVTYPAYPETSVEARAMLERFTADASRAAADANDEQEENAGQRQARLAARRREIELMKVKGA